MGVADLAGKVKGVEGDSSLSVITTRGEYLQLSGFHYRKQTLWPTTNNVAPDKTRLPNDFVLEAKACNFKSYKQTTHIHPFWT